METVKVAALRTDGTIKMVRVPKGSQAAIHNDQELIESYAKMFEGDIRFAGGKDDTKWNKLCGAQEIKSYIESRILGPLMFPKDFQQFGGSVNKNVLLFGDTGSGKSIIPPAAASYANVNYIFVHHLETRYVDHPSKIVSGLFVAARRNAPIIIHIDDNECYFGALKKESPPNTLAHHYGRIRQFVAELSSEENYGVAVFGGTCLPWTLDKELSRQFVHKLHLGAPTINARVEKLKLEFENSGYSTDWNESDFKKIARKLENYSFGYIDNVVYEISLYLKFRVAKATHFIKPSGESKYKACFCKHDKTHGIWCSLDYLKSRGDMVELPTFLTKSMLEEFFSKSLKTKEKCFYQRKCEEYGEKEGTKFVSANLKGKIKMAENTNSLLAKLGMVAATVFDFFNLV